MCKSMSMRQTFRAGYYKSLFGKVISIKLLVNPICYRIMRECGIPILNGI